jgi:hypothetical protein
VLHTPDYAERLIPAAELVDDRVIHNRLSHRVSPVGSPQ